MRHLLIFLLVAGLAAAEPPPVPDPYGLGERLALIDLLRDTYGVKAVPGATLEALRALYAERWQVAQTGPAQVGNVPDAPDEVVASADRRVRLRARIEARHGIKPDPALDEAGLQALLHRLDAQLAERNAAAVADRIEAERTSGTTVEPMPVLPPEEEEAQPAPPPRAATRTPHREVPTVPEPPAKPTAGAAIEFGPWIRPLEFKAHGVTNCALAVEGEISAVLVAFGTDHNGAFIGMPAGMLRALKGATGIRRAVLLMGHGTGTAIGGEALEDHIKANREFYETMGNTAPAQPVECMVFASCSPHNPNQMLAMRDGLGYWPTFRVATGANANSNGLVILAALHAVAIRPAAPAWRGLFRWGPPGKEVACFGEIGKDGERDETEFFRIVEDGAKGWKVEEQR